MKKGTSVQKRFVALTLQAFIACGTLTLSHGAQAADPTWGARAGISLSTCGGEVAESHNIGLLGSPGIDVELTASQYSCGGMYGYAGDLPYAYARSKASLSEGTMGIYAEVSGLGQLLTYSGSIVTAPVALANVSSNLQDVLSFTVSAHTPGRITFTSTVTGSYTENVGSVQFSMGGDMTCTSDSCWGNLSGNWGADLWGIDNGGGGTTTYTRWIDVADNALPITFDFELGASLSGSAKPFVGVFGYPNVASGTIDYLHTAAFGYTLPEGVTFTSASGQFMSPVPVPAAVWLFGSGLLGLIGVARRRVKS
ncbi:MAG: VPLPA-CTERM sorting domain-containing protein [Sulfuricaulis sp.]|uniref:VPLPA-CTERM sorting domain-containing protein n=1 Tax=Sulfuricaulis sp. TaxID=2003553 RepID=UPI0025CEC828|nr:VPLPA-CTERM sorting domain-containing protein [Sulfuricaulis sp.]MCR4347384.1 VPLPA-CTERM sorting domain-containing protein [Sulfuricaulis sp.]